MTSNDILFDPLVCIVAFSCLDVVIYVHLSVLTILRQCWKYSKCSHVNMLSLGLVFCCIRKLKKSHYELDKIMAEFNSYAANNCFLLGKGNVFF